ncbi:Maf family protein [Dietzia sp.]|uniref:Maf family protein n=1 Tax=Dietzia sp. TaxID=1871616 RepID=UPI002FDA2C48
MSTSMSAGSAARARTNPIPPAFVLASASPSRLQILRSGGVEPIVRPSGVDEDEIVSRLPADMANTDVVKELARAKARFVAEGWAEEIARESGAERMYVLGCDSMLLVGNELEGKPHTKERAWERWQALRGETAHLVTGHALAEIAIDTPGHGARTGVGRVVTESSVTAVHFGTPADADLRAYIDTEEPLECAGAFTLEALGGWFIDGIEGDPSGVIGLSLPLMRHMLERVGASVSELWSPDLIGREPDS